jgi:hypothetical protein
MSLNCVCYRKGSAIWDIFEMGVSRISEIFPPWPVVRKFKKKYNPFATQRQWKRRVSVPVRRNNSPVFRYQYSPRTKCIFLKCRSRRYAQRDHLALNLKPSSLFTVHSFACLLIGKPAKWVFFRLRMVRGA